VGQVSDPPAVAGLSTRKLLVVRILHQESRVCHSERNDYCFCDFVQLCVMELFTANDSGVPRNLFGGGGGQKIYLGKGEGGKGGLGK